MNELSVKQVKPIPKSTSLIPVSYPPPEDTLHLLESYGFRSIINSKYQSWARFTKVLFNNEFDEVYFRFDLKNTPGFRYFQTEDEDTESLTALYFKRPINQMRFYLPVASTLKEKLDIIKDILPDFFNGMGKDKLSQPILVISEIKIIKYQHIISGKTDYVCSKINFIDSGIFFIAGKGKAHFFGHLYNLLYVYNTYNILLFNDRKKIISMMVNMIFVLCLFRQDNLYITICF